MFSFKKLLKEFEFLSIALSDDEDNEVYYNINRGGCGYIALKLFDALSKHYPCKIRMFDYRHIRLQHNGRNIRSITTVVNHMDINSIRDFWDYDLNLVHVVVEIDIKGEKYMADSTGIFPSEIMEAKWETYTLVKGHIPRSKMQILWNNERGWNDCFDRENLSSIDQVLDRNLKFLDKKAA